MSGRVRAASGVSELDRLLGGLYIGDNVVWHDDAGSLADPFCMSFIQASQAQGRPLIYVSFDRSPRNLFDKLGALSENPLLTILDCFTYGKGAGSPVFLRFSEEFEGETPCRLVRLENPRDPERVMDALYGIHGTMEGDVRLVFESMTGMQELWGGEEHILNFYAHSCPRLYDLNTIAYWLMEKRAHSSRLRAQINQIAQVAVDLSIRRGKTYLTVLKAERRQLDTVNKPYIYWSRGLNITFNPEGRDASRVDLGMRLREFRTKRGLSQTELAKLVGVTPSTISQIESNLIYPSLPALIKMAEVLFIEVSSFFQDSVAVRTRPVFPASEAVDIRFPDQPEGSVFAKRLTPVDMDSKVEPYLLEIPPKGKLASHFFIHKGEEIGYLLSGKMEFRLDKAVYKVRSGDVIYLTSETPTQWSNPGPGVARLLWMKVK